MKNSDDRNLERITNLIRDLESKKWSVSWEELQQVEAEIQKYQNKLRNGEYYEPRF